MDNRKRLEFQIEEQRNKMYQASGKQNNYEQVMNISQHLDQLLNKLEKLKKHEGVK
ncbi:aspartyl-phosphate phosphatase Spo0E family protein [Virgibacillus oceani]